MAVDGATAKGGGYERGRERGGQGQWYSAGYGAKAAGGPGYRERDQGSWQRSKISGAAAGGGTAPTPAAPDAGLALPQAIEGVGDATELDDYALKCIATVMEHAATELKEAEVALTKLGTWLAPSADRATDRRSLTRFAASQVPAAVVVAIRNLRDDPLAAALCCNLVVTSSSSAEAAAAYLRAGVLEEIGALMDRHPTHGGVQNVCLLAVCGLMKENASARQAVSLGFVGRVLQAMEATVGREVQFNSLSALRILTEQGRAQRAGLQEATLRAKVAHSGDEALVTAADEVLALVMPRFKEVLCWHWQSGWCKLGARCTYAHGPDDLRTQ